MPFLSFKLRSLPPSKLNQMNLRILGRKDPESTLEFEKFRILATEWDKIGRLTNLLGKTLPLLTNPTDSSCGFTVTFSHIKSLSLYKIRIPSLPLIVPMLTDFRYLDALFLSECGLTRIDESILVLKTLKVISFSKNRIHLFPDSLSNLKRLTETHLNACDLQEIPAFIFKLNRLESIQIGNNQIRTIPDEISQLKRLKALYMWKNRIKELPQSMSSLTALEELDLSDNRIQDIPSWLVKLSNLKEIWLMSNSIRNSFKNNRILKKLIKKGIKL